MNTKNKSRNRYMREYLKTHPKYRKYKKEYNKKYRKEHKLKIQKLNSEYYTKNYDILRKKQNEYMKKYQKTHKKERNKYRRNRYKIDINYKIQVCMRSRLYMALKGQIKSTTTRKLVGCSIEHLKQYLERQFKKGMSWSNYGKWHVDHIKPCASFDLSKLKQQKLCFNYTNLQPLWAKENKIKEAEFKRKIRK